MRFVDIHSHVVPSEDDGVASIEEGLALLATAAERGTGVVYATPHVWPSLALSNAREAAVRSAHARMAPPAAELGVRLELGFEVTPAPARLAEDPWRYRLGAIDAVLIDAPFRCEIELTMAYAEYVEASGLVPIIAHPERSEALAHSPAIAGELHRRGWLIQVNSSSLLGCHGVEVCTRAWSLLGAGHADFVASDGHRKSRPLVLADAHAQARARLGEGADRLFDGSALASIATRLPRSRAATRDA